MKLVFAFVLVYTISETIGLIEPTKFINNRIYALENQHQGNYLTAGEGGMYIRTRDQGTHNINQLWKVQAVNKDGFKLVPENGEPAIDSLWQPIYVGHGKYQLRNHKTGKCLEATAKGMETECQREDLIQRWYPHIKEEKKQG